MSTIDEYAEVVDAACDAWREGRPWPDDDGTSQTPLVRMTMQFLDCEFQSIRASMAQRLRGWLEQEPSRMTDDELRLAFEVQERRGYFAKLNARNPKRGPTRIEREADKRGVRKWVGTAPVDSINDAFTMTRRVGYQSRAEADAPTAPVDD